MSEFVFKLSGIGDKDQLQHHGITPIVHLPGVGANLQGRSSHFLLYCRCLFSPDNDEIPAVWKLKQNITGFASLGDIFIASPGSSNVAGIEPDIAMEVNPVEFTGFKRGELFV